VLICVKSQPAPARISSQMSNRSKLLTSLVLSALALVALWKASTTFVGTPAASQVPTHSRSLTDHQVALRARGGARGGGPDIDAWIAEVCTGGGGEPSGAIKEYIMKWFWPAADPFTGRGGAAPGKKDHKKVFEILKDAVAKGPDFVRGSSSAGFGSVNGETTGVDGSPYTWVVGSMTPGGMFLMVTREFPGGKQVRPLFACKIGEEEKMWNSLNWDMVNKRLDITAGLNLEPVEGVKQR